MGSCSSLAIITWISYSYTTPCHIHVTPSSAAICSSSTHYTLFSYEITNRADHYDCTPIWAGKHCILCWLHNAVRSFSGWVLHANYHAAAHSPTSRSRSSTHSHSTLL